jgi:hypothetical protein
MAGRMFDAARNVAPFVLAAVGVMVLLVSAWRFVGSFGFSYDFAAYELAARRLVDGDPLYPPGVAEAYNSGAYENLYLYAPPLAVALMPAAPFEAGVVDLAWLWARVGVLLAGCLILPVALPIRLAALGVAGLSFPILYDLNLGNLSIVLLALSALIWRFREHPLGTAALAAVLSVRYSFALVLIEMVASRRWKMLAWTVFGGLVIAAATLPFVGIAGWFAYVEILTGLRDVTSGEHNLNLADTAIAAGLPVGLRPLFIGGSIAIALGATLIASLRRDRETAVVVALTGTLLFWPFLHPHYLAQLIIPAAFLASRGWWWAVALPLLGWLPGTLLPVVAIVATLAPLVATHRDDARDPVTSPAEANQVSAGVSPG